MCCSECDHEFLLWNHCRQYGRTVRDHKILAAFPCPACQRTIRKSRLRRTISEPVRVGYKCCSTQQVEHSLSTADRIHFQRVELHPPLAQGFYPTTLLPEGANLSQPRRHGLTSIDAFYTRRNLAAMSHLWRTIHCVRDDQVAGFLTFIFTSLYKRVTKLSEFDSGVAAATPPTSTSRIYLMKPMCS